MNTNISSVDYLNSIGQDSSFSNRKKLASEFGNNNFTGSSNDNLDLLTKLKARAPKTLTSNIDPASTIINPPAKSAGISVDQFKSSPKIERPPNPKANINGYSGIIGSGITSVSSNLSNLNKINDSLLKKVTEDSQNISSVMNKLLDKTADSNVAEKDAGVETYQNDVLKYTNELENINAEAKTISRDAAAIPLTLQEQSIGQGVTDAGLEPIQASELRKNSIKALTLASRSDIVAAAATGSVNKLNLAKEKAKKVIDLKYEPLEKELAFRSKQYELNKDLLSIFSKERTEALGAKIDEEKILATYFKDTEKQKVDIILKAAPYAPQDLLDRASQAPDAMGAARILGAYAGDYLQTQKTKQEIIKMQIENGTYSPEEVVKGNIVTKENGFGFEDFKRGVAAVESSNNYNERGPIITTGLYKGDRAYGRYQVMGKNLPEWLKQAGLPNMTPEQFRFNNDAQDKVFENQSEVNYAKYGNWGDAASVWFTGKPIDKAGNASDGYNTNSQYINKIFNAMGVRKIQPVKIEGVPDKVVQAVSSGRLQSGQLVDANTGAIPKNISADKQDGLLALKDLSNKIEEYKNMYIALQNEGITGFAGTGFIKGAKNSIFPSENATALKSLQSEIVDLLSRARSGAALSVVEEARYSNKLPTVFSGDQLFGNPIVELDGLKSSISNTLNTKLKGYGAMFAPDINDIYYQQNLNILNNTNKPETVQNYGYEF